MSKSEIPDPWPALDYAEMRPTVDHLRRLVQIAGKYTLDQPFEPNWGNVLMSLTPRGVMTPTLRAGDILFDVHYEILDDRVSVTANSGTVSMPLGPGSVAGFCRSFAELVEPLGIPPLGSLSQPEIAGAPPLDQDHEQRPYDGAAARRAWSAQASAAASLGAYQAPFRGHRPRVGLWWGGFDVSATRYNGRPVTPPATHPLFMQNGMTGEVVSVGFVLGDDKSPQASFYAYISPAPDGLDEVDFGPGATWLPEAGLIVLPWELVRTSEDPEATVVRFADAVYAAAVDRAGWPGDLVGSRHDGWYAARHPVFGPAS